MIQAAQMAALAQLAKFEDPAEVIAKIQSGDLIATERSIYFRRATLTSAIAKGAEWSFGGVGNSDDGASLGFTGGTILDEEHTNLERDGSLPDGHFFIGLGVGFAFPDNTELATLRALRQADVFMQYGDRSRRLPLGRVQENPSPFQIAGEHSAVIETDTTATSSTITEYASFLRQLGPVRMGEVPLFALEGGGNKAGQVKTILRHTTALTPATSKVFELHWLGYYLQPFPR